MTSLNKPYSISLLIGGYKVLSTSSVANLGSLIQILFHFPENADKYTQVFVMSYGFTLYYQHVSIMCDLFLLNPLNLVVGGVHGGHHAPL